MRKNGNTKTLFVVIAMIMAVACMALAACGGKPKDNTPSIAIETTIELEVGTTKQLAPYVSVGGDKKEGGVFTYETADASIASITTDGLIKANKKGETIVTVSGTYNGTDLAQVTVNVKVKDQAPAPVLNPEIEAGYVSMNLLIDETRQLEPYVVDGERILDGGEFAFASDDDTVASVTQSGLVTALKKGETQIIVTGSYDGTTLDAVRIPVEVRENMTVSTGISDNALTLYTGEGRDTQNPFATQYTVQPEVTLNGEKITNATVMLTPVSEDVVSVNGTTLAAVGVGSTKVTVKVTSPSGTTESVVIDVTVKKPYSDISFAERPLICLQKGTDWTQFNLTYSEVTEVRVAGKAVTCTVEDDVFKITSRNCATGENLALQFETEEEILNAKADIADITIGTRAELATLARNVKDYLNAYIVVTADIDCQDTSHTSDHSYAWQPHVGGTWINSRSVWSGTFDGRGHTLNNVNVEASFMYEIAEGGVLKNLAVTNIRKWGTERGIVAGELKGTIENCYFHLSDSLESKNSAWYVPFITQVRNTAVVKNVVLSIPDNGNAKTLSNYKNKNAIMEVTEGAKIENLYVIVKGGSGKLTNSTNYNKAANGGMFESVHEFYRTAQDNKSKFDGKFWNSTDTLIFDSARKYFTPDTATGKTVTAKSELLVGGSVELQTNFVAVNWQLKAEVPGVSVDNGVLSVGAQVASDTKITVIVTGFDSVLGSYYTVESAELTVIGAESVDLPDKIITGANRTSDVFTVDMSEKGVVEITSVTFGNEAVTGYTFANNVFTLNLKNIVTGNGNLTISAKTQSGTFCTYSKQIEKADYAIGNAAEMKQFGAAVKAKGSKAAIVKASSQRKLATVAPITAVLTADIDYKEQDFTKDLYGLEFVGTFDGRGYTIYNMHGTDSLFPNLNGTASMHTEVKNVAFVNAVVTATNKNYAGMSSMGTGSWFTYMINKSIVHDLYIDVTVKNCTDSQFAMVRQTTQTTSEKDYSVIANIVANVNYDESCTLTGPRAAVTISVASGFFNVYVVCNKAPVPTKDTTGITGGCFDNADFPVEGSGAYKYRYRNVHYYPTLADMMAEVTTLPGALPAIAKLPTEPMKPQALVEPTAPVEPGEDATEEEKNEYQAALSQYQEAKQAYDTEMAKYNDINDDTYAEYREAMQTYNEQLALYNNTVASTGNQFENAYNRYVSEGANGFSSELWQIVEKDNKKYLFFKSTVLADEDVAQNFAITTPYEDGNIAAGIPIAISANRATSWTVSELADDEYELTDGFITVSSNVAANTQFTVRAEFTDVFGKLHTAEKQFTVTRVLKTENADELIYGKNKAYDPEITLKSGETPVTVAISGIQVDFTFEGEKLKIVTESYGELVSGEQYDVQIIVVTQSEIITYITKLSVYDFTVGTLDEWKAFEAAKAVNHNAAQHLYVALTADLDFGGDYVSPRKDSDSWYSLEGYGHSIQNVTVSGSHAFLGDVRGTAAKHAFIRNIIFKGITQKNGHGGLLCLDAEYCDFENLYIEGTITTTDSTLVAGIVARSGYGNADSINFKNVVVNVTFSVTDKFNAVSAGSMTYENVYAISSTSNGLLGGTTVTGSASGLYQTAEEFKAGNVTLGEAWTITDTELKLLGTTVLTFTESSEE